MAVFRLVRRLAGVLAVTLLAACAGHGSIVVAPPPGVVIVPGPGAPQKVHIPPGHYPPPGSCRIWVPGVPPGQQSPPGHCRDLQHRVPAGAVLVRG